jgi:DNA invertase Pin-like site-specific DNA recombinase
MAKRARPGDSRVAVAYLRASTGRQDLGLDAQRTALEAWAASRGLTIAAWHVDPGVSGSAPLEDRPGLLGALAALREHRAGVLLVARRDRLARDVVVAGLVERAVTAAGAHVFSADGTGNGQSPTDVFTKTILDAAGQLERALIRARTRAALAEKRARGEKLGGRLPFGFRLGDDGRTLVEYEPEQQIVRQIRALREQGVTLRTIVARLAELGVQSRAGTPLGLTQVAKLAA